MPIILVILIVVFGKGGVWWLGEAPRGRSVWRMVSHVSAGFIWLDSPGRDL